MKRFTKIMAAALMLCLCLSAFAFPAFAATVPEATIDMSKTGSLTIYKYDLTNAEKDGVWDSSYVSTGVYDETVNVTLGGTVTAGTAISIEDHDLGNGDKSFGYAIKGVEFTYLKVAEIVQYKKSGTVEVLYGINRTVGADLLRTLGLDNGAQRYTDADGLDSTKYFYQSDVLIDALSAALEANSTTVKNALETYIKANGGTPMPETGSDGKTGATDLELGLYLVCETAVPEMVTSTCSPFLVSVPMTSVNGTNATDGGTRWIYDITLYPKNLTGIPSLEKTLREDKEDTGKNDGKTDDITDGYAHTGTASDGDVIDYQIVSTLPSITSASTYLTCYTFIDTLSAGLSYNKNDVVIEFYTDAACTDLITEWTQADGKFTVTYSTTEKNESVMTIEMTARGLSEINTSKQVYPGATMVNSGYSDCTIRITYKATVHSDASVIYGDNGNPNEVVLMWSRTNQDYYDTLVDDAHVYTYALELTKLFSDGKGDFSNVEFIIRNKTDGYFVTAALDAATGVYYVTGHVTDEASATHFVPQTVDGKEGVVLVKGLEDDTYIVTEVRTDDGYTLLKENIEVVISVSESTELCNIYASDTLGLIQNDPRYATIINDTGDLKNMPQKHLEHKLLTASATVDGNAFTMKADGDSDHAAATLTVVNTRGFDLPPTGERWMWVYPAAGFAFIAGAVIVVLLAGKKRKKEAVETAE